MGSSGPSNHHGVHGRSWSVRSDTFLPHPILQAPSHSSSVPPPGFLHPRRPQMTRFEGGEDALPRHSRPSAAGCCGDRWGCGERQPQRPHPGQRLAGRVPPAQANSTVAIHPVLTAVLKKASASGALPCRSFPPRRRLGRGKNTLAHSHHASTSSL